MREGYAFIVVGGGIAGVSCVEALQTWLPDESVLLLSATPSIKAVTRALQLTKTLVQFDVEEQTGQQLAARHKTLDVEIDAVVAVDSKAHVVTMASGRRATYGRLCLCMGGRPRIIAEGNPHVIGIRDTDSVNRLRDRLAGARRIVITGNGGIASELVYEVRGVDKVWVIKDQHISSVFLDPGAAEFVSGCLVRSDEKTVPVVRRVQYSGDASGAALGPDWLSHCQLNGSKAGNDLRIEFGVCLVNVTSNAPNAEFPVSCVLDTGTVIEADLVISATGVIPCSDSVTVTPSALALAVDGGIVVDEQMSSSVEDVFAAGDLATAGWSSAPHWLQMRLWTQARQTGAHAGRAMAAAFKGEQVHLDFCFELFSHVTRFFGLKVILLGLYNAQKLAGDCEYLVRVTRGQEYIKLVMQRGRVQGAVLIGETELEEMCENLILDQLDVSSLGDQLLDPDIDIDDYFD